MGQYHNICNFTTMEELVPWNYDNGAKLMEWSYAGNDLVNAFEYLINDKWSGDDVLVVGDYANDVKHGELTRIVRSYKKKYGVKDLYDAKKEALHINPPVKCCRYIINDLEKEFVDIKTQPLQAAGYVPKENRIFGMQIHPLPLLLAVSNGLGGGDYNGINKWCVGSWCYAAGYIRTSDEKPAGYEERQDIIFDEETVRSFGPYSSCLYKGEKRLSTVTVLKNLYKEHPGAEISGAGLFLTEKEIAEIKGE